MTKPVIVTRLGKGSELTFQEGDDNFANLRDATISVSGDSGDTQNIDLNGTITVAGGTGITTTMSSGTITVNGFSGSYSNLSDKPSLATVATSGSYTDLTSKPTIPTNNNELINGAGFITGIDSTAVTTALGFTPESTSNKNANNGYAGLDSSGKVASAQLPSYVDDVVEVANYAALPTEGESGKIYIELAEGKIYRWSGSAYVEIVGSPGSTDAVTEGETNLYYTDSRARSAISGTTGIAVNTSTGAISLDISSIPGGSAGGTPIDYIDGTGDYIYFTSSNWAPASFMNGVMVSFSGTSLAASGIMSGTSYFIVSSDSGSYRIQIADTMGGSAKDLNTVANPNDITMSMGGGGGGGGSSYSLLYSSGSGTITWQEETAPTSPSLSSLSDVMAMAPSDGQVLTYDSGSMNWVNETPAAAGISDVVSDSTPQLGGSLDVNSQSIVSVSNGNIVLAPNGTGRVSLDDVLWPAADGSNGQVLSTNGSGSASWTTVGGGNSYAILESAGHSNNINSGSGTLNPTWTEILDANNIVSNTTSQFTLSSGTYLIELSSAGMLASGSTGGSGWISAGGMFFDLYSVTASSVLHRHYQEGARFWSGSNTTAEIPMGPVYLKVAVNPSVSTTYEIRYNNSGFQKQFSAYSAPGKSFRIVIIKLA